MLTKEYYCSVNMERYIAAIIDHMNKGCSLQSLTKPAGRIKDTIDRYKNR